jgi:hypothetical protein
MPPAEDPHADARERRATFNKIWAGISIVFAALSIWAAACNDFPFLWKVDRDNLGKAIVGIWAVGPPVFFWVDWVRYCSYMGPESKERDVAKHTHDLSRNIWLGLFAVLTFAFFRAKL